MMMLTSPFPRRAIDEFAGSVTLADGVREDSGKLEIDAR
jgi:hypothetical protein